MLNISQDASPLIAVIAAIATFIAVTSAWLEQRRSLRLRVRVLEVARQLARRNFGHTMEARCVGELAQIAQAFDTASANLRRHSQKMAALLQLDRALLRGVGLEPAMISLLPAIAAALQSRSASIVLLNSDTLDRARSFDFLADQVFSAAPRSVIIDGEQLRSAPSGIQVLDLNAIGVDTENFLGPLTRSGARAFRLHALEADGQIAGFLCIGFRVDAHDNDDADISSGEIAERLSLAIAGWARSGAATAPAFAAAATAAPGSASTTQRAVAARSPLESGLHRALQRAEFALVYQPIVDAHSGHCGGVEALLRWPVGPDGASRLAAEFVPVAEQSGLIVDLGDWVLRTACQQFDSWRRDGIELDYVSVNVSARQLRHKGLLPTVLACLQRGGMAPSQLQLEMVESLLNDGPETLAVLRELADRGVRLALDDFGAGDSALGRLQSLPIHTIKIDRSCVAAMGADATTRAIINAAIDVGAATRRRVIAVGVERSEQLEFLEAAGCDAMQGFFFAPPMPASDLAAYLNSQQLAAACISTRAA